MIMKKIASLLSFSLIALLTCVGQTVIYTTDFGTDGLFPTGYTNSSQIQISQVGPSSGYTGASGGDYVNCLNNVGALQTLTVNPPISTVGFENINLIWGARQNNTPAIQLEWSTDGFATPFIVTYTEVANDDTWALVNGGIAVNLPAGANGAANLQFRFSYTGSLDALDYYKIDDFTVEGTCIEPTTQASSLAASIIGDDAALLSWDIGNGASRLIAIHEATAVTATPADNTTYNADNIFGSGDELAIGNFEYVIYNDQGTSATVTGLSLGTVYDYTIFEYNCDAGTEDYLTVAPPNFSFTTCDGGSPSVEASTDVTSNIAVSSFQLDWTIGDGERRIVVVKAGSAVDVSPTDNTVYTADADFTLGEDIGSSNIVVFNGTGNSVTITGLTVGTEYHFKVFEYNCEGDPKYLTTAPLTGSQTTAGVFYSHSTTDLEDVNNWWSNRDGTGTNPANFTQDDKQYVIEDDGSSTAAAWTVSGTNSKVIIETGIGFTVTNGNTVTASIELEGTGAITIDDGTNPTLSVISSTSTVTYSTNAASIETTTYGNLVIDKALSLSGDITVSGALTLNDVLTLDGNILTLDGTIAGASTISGSNASDIIIGGTGALGTIEFTTGNELLENLTINRTTSGTVTLGSDLTIGGATSGTGVLTLTDGSLDLNGNTLSFSNSSTSIATGTITGSNAASIIINGTGTFGDGLAMDQTSAITRTLMTLDFDRVGQDIVLASDLTISNSMISRNGSCSIGANTLLLEGDYTSTSGDLKGTTSSNLIINGLNPITSAIVFDLGFNALGTLTMNRVNETLTLGSDLDIATALSITAGTLSNGGNIIDGTGAALNLAAGSNLTLTGTTTFPTFTSETIDRTSTVEYAGGVQSVAVKDYGHIKFSAADVKSLAGPGGSLAGEMSITAGTFNMGDHAFTFKSDATGTAQLLEITSADNPALLNATNVTVERYVEGSIGFRIFSPPGTGATIADYNNEIAMSGPTLVGSNDDSPTSWPSTYMYNQGTLTGSDTDADAGWYTPTNVSQTIQHTSDVVAISATATAGITTYITTVTSAITPMPLIADVTVSLESSQGTFELNNLSFGGGGAGAPIAGYHLIGNPYPCSLDWGQVVANGMNGIAASGAMYTVDGATNNFSPSTTAILASGEGGFIKVTSGTNDIIIEENDKLGSGVADPFNKTNNNGLPGLELIINVGTHYDQAQIEFKQGTDDLYEHQFDALKMDNFSGKTNIAVVSSDNKDLHWNYVDDNINTTIPIKVYRNSYSGIVESYILELNNIDELLQNNKCISFEDIETGVSFPLTGDTTYTFTMNDTVTQARLFITINSPLTTNQTNLTCEGTNDGTVSVFGTGPGVTYTWTDQAGNSIPVFGGNLNNLTAGYYYVEVDGLIGSCSVANATFEITEPSALIINSEIENVICNGENTGSIELTAIGGEGTSYSYNWSDGSNGAILSNLSAGNYTVSVVDSEGCETIENIDITENELVSLTHSSTDATCFGLNDGYIDLEVITTASFVFDYLWSNGETTQDIDNLSAGQYDVTVTNENGCVSISSMLIDEPIEINVLFEASSDTINLNQGSVIAFTNLSTGTNIYNWNFGDGGTSTDMSPWYEFSSIGTYIVTLDASNGACDGAFSSNIVVNNVSSITTIANENEMKFIEVGNQLYAYSKSLVNEQFQISIYNGLGQLVSSTAGIADGNKIEIILPKTKGVYLIKLASSDQEFIKKYIVAN